MDKAKIAINIPNQSIERGRSRTPRSVGPSPVLSAASTSDSLRGISPPSALYIDEEAELPWEPLDNLPPSERRYYTYVDILESEFRLLCISPGGNDENIHCSLKATPIESIKKRQLKYQALSYAWGDDKPGNVIFLQDVSVRLPPPDRSALQLMSRQSKPHPFLVRENLYSLLKTLRSETKDVWVWVDAICINQANDAEKSHQLPKMPDIYGNAWNVTIWLGETEDGTNGSSDLALNFLATILNLRLLDFALEKGGHDEHMLQSWVAFAKLLRRPWFSRRWVIQEVAFARRLSIRCGEKVISWADFADAVDLFIDNLDRIRSLFSASELSELDPDALSHVESSGAASLVTISRNVFRKTDQGIVISRLVELDVLVLKAAPFAATDRRDVVYALLALASDDRQGTGPDAGNIPAIVADYSKHDLDVYSEFVEYSIRRSGSLDIICRHWALESRFWLPSWIGVVSESAFGAPSLLTGRINGESLVGEPGQRRYNASRGTSMSVSIRRRQDTQLDSEPDMAGPKLTDTSFITWSTEEIEEPSNPAAAVPATFVHEEPEEKEENTLSPEQPLKDLPHYYSYLPHRRPVAPPQFAGILHTKGILLGEIGKVSPRVVDGTISDECLRILSWPGKETDNKVPDEVWRTLVADRGPDGKTAPSWYRRACAYALTKKSPEGDLNTSKLIGTKTIPTTVVEYLKRVQNVVWSRKFFSFRTAQSFHPSREVVGIGPRNIRVGDLVCILYGCSVPVVVRKDEKDLETVMRLLGMKTGEEVTEWYQHVLQVSLIGECYAHGHMDGETFMGPYKGIKKHWVKFAMW